MQRFTVVYPDGSKQKVSSSKRDEMIVAGSLRKDGEHYRYIGEVRTLHALADLSQLSIQQNFDDRRFFPGSFIFVDPQGRKHRELLESPTALAIRVSAQNFT